MEALDFDTPVDHGYALECAGATDLLLKLEVNKPAFMCCTCSYGYVYFLLI